MGRAHTPPPGESDTKVTRGGITKMGSTHLRWAAIEAVTETRPGSTRPLYPGRIQSVQEDLVSCGLWDGLWDGGVVSGSRDRPSDAGGHDPLRRGDPSVGIPGRRSAQMVGTEWAVRGQVVRRYGRTGCRRPASASRMQACRTCSYATSPTTSMPSSSGAPRLPGSRCSSTSTAELTRLATTPTMAEVLERIGRRRGGRVGLDTAVADLHNERARR